MAVEEQWIVDTLNKVSIGLLSFAIGLLLLCAYMSIKWRNEERELLKRIVKRIRERKRQSAAPPGEN